ncbi:MAG TPA: imidazole glycerol phosphate synthase subunit HisH [Candidatus Omnitrophota bacterium]|nr:imidazole glycerol phosphate synthase subunit HisH [Candidatus Omnitrophota bacterium]HRZ15545.1 imidazole glycerol phosphate synthase subunit HisH [Candidatus Omnitrophota bacterium]
MIEPAGGYIAVIDYGMSNLFSVMQACAGVGLKAVITSDPRVLSNAAGAILPGVGAFGYAMTELEARGLVSGIKSFIAQGKPLMGICLGMQLLLDSSDEFGASRGLGIVRGAVRRFPGVDAAGQKVRIPHVGWSRVFLPEGKTGVDPILNGIPDRGYMYFVHSYYVQTQENVSILQSVYGGAAFCSALRKGAVTAFQFHPEKSAGMGLRIYRNFKDEIVKGGLHGREEGRDQAVQSSAGG